MAKPTKSSSSRNQSPLELQSLASHHRTLLGVLATAVALALAVLWCFVVPHKAATAPPIQALIITVAHPAAWVMLAITALLYTVRARRLWMEAPAWIAFALYIAFAIALIV